jgi:hypothetical protein
VSESDAVTHLAVADLRDWLEARRPEASADLRARIVEQVLEADSAAGPRDVGHPGPPSSPAAGREPDGPGQGLSDDDRMARWRVHQLVETARDRLDVARARPGRVRASAFELLVADALVTYACEAALETEDPVAALEAIAEVGWRR